MILNDVVNIGQGAFNLVIECFPVAQEIIFALVTPLLALVVFALALGVHAGVVLGEVAGLLVVVVFEGGLVAGFRFVVEVFHCLVRSGYQVAWLFGNLVKHRKLVLKLFHC